MGGWSQGFTLKIIFSCSLGGRGGGRCFFQFPDTRFQSALPKWPTGFYCQLRGVRRMQCHAREDIKYPPHPPRRPKDWKQIWIENFKWPISDWKFQVRREFKGQQNRGNRTESLWEEICLWEGLWEGGFSEIFERFWEVFRGFQRFWEVFRGFERCKRFLRGFQRFFRGFQRSSQRPLRGRFPLRGSQSCCP